MNSSSWVAGSAGLVMWLALIVFNLGVIVLLRHVLAEGNMREALEEKHPGPNTQPADGQPPASYSRTAGAVGAMVLACFVWGLGNVLLYKGFASPGTIDELVSGLGGFFLGTSALFAPYAFNQLGIAFKPRS
ncbi:hypothetical protein [Devosia sp.]|uniref:hypothetical protein n=1 Tax=Devosia sp. TaxID=1871048 RepID=UPI003A93783D